MSFSMVSFTHSTLPSGKLKHLLIVLVLKCGRVEIRFLIKALYYFFACDLDATYYMNRNCHRIMILNQFRTFSFIGCEMNESGICNIIFILSQGPNNHPKTSQTSQRSPKDLSKTSQRPPKDLPNTELRLPKDQPYLPKTSQWLIYKIILLWGTCW